MDDSDDEIPTLQNLDDEIPTLQNLDDEIPTLQNLDDAAATFEGDDDVPFPRKAPAPQDAAPLPPVPVTILTGFLGSGKTTLVRHLLTAPHRRRIAVIENEFGGGDASDARLADRLGLAVGDASALSVETMIARDGTDGSNLADFIELPNGCVCCTVKDSLVETLERLLEKRTDLDYILIEASGMADPGPVASVFWLDDALDSRLRLDGIVTCVDAKNLGSQLAATSSASPPGTAMLSGSSEAHDGGGDEAARQIAFADRIIVNKVDLLPPSATLEDVLEEIRAINPTAPVKTALYSRIEDLDWILDARCFDAARVKDVEAAFQRSAAEVAAAALNEDFCGSCTEPPPPFIAPHRHTRAVGTVALIGRGSADLRRLHAWLASVLWPDQDASDGFLRARLEEDLRHATSRLAKAPPRTGARPQTVYRVKGVLSVGHARDAGTGTVVPGSNDWVDAGLAAGLVGAGDGLDARRFIVQAVNDLWDVLPAGENLRWEAAETRCCKLVVIGKWLDEDRLREGFRDCFLDPLATGA